MGESKKMIFYDKINKDMVIILPKYMGQMIWEQEGKTDDKKRREFINLLVTWSLTESISL